MSSESTDLLLERRLGSVVEYTLNRPNKLNALSDQLTHLLKTKLQYAETDETVEVIVLRGNGRAFCAGGDVVALSLQAKTGKDEEIQKANTFMRGQYLLNHICATLDSKVTVAFWHSITMGGGMGFSVPLDFRVCSPNTMIAMPECSISFFPDVGASYFLNQLGPGIGMYLALTGNRLTGYEAVAFGLATHYMEIETIEEAVQALSKASSRDQVNRLLTGLASQPSNDAIAAAKEKLKYIKETFTAPNLNQIFARLEAMNNAWSRAALVGLRSGSPTAVSVTFEMLKRGKSKTAEQCREMEYVLHTHFMRLPDFIEGVDKKLVRKPARKPQWQPSSRSEVTQAMIDAFFVPVPTDGVLQLGAKVADPKKQNRFVRHGSS
ncbi:ClpP/crotonase-like domain-containing protein [Protomyces lactucae-debilis]|uniref:3-hydroxyisobutyryl-CoA hydrolase n=1 Tax=Protomyces lactucae-debilis TaxID=2754530 RepID=A0A1Y2FFE2_PROLT|nr:ClpP/crotonase-like domain-containing protein [Protomyces lactucae-debilis]ORY82680.1 ClpP/crotonase-like domain-containing protein [Protomyces lactucae-debilis]